MVFQYFGYGVLGGYQGTARLLHSSKIAGLLLSGCYTVLDGC